MREIVALEGLSREDWLAARRNGIGGSDIPAILGLSKYRGAFDVYCDKVTGEEQPSNAAMRLGQHLEDGVALMYAEETGSVVTKPTHLYGHDRYEWALGSPDRFTDNEGLGILEVKVARDSREYEDGAPDGHQIQCLWYLAITGLPYADLAALLGGREVRYYRIERDEPTIRNLIELAGQFWQRVLDRDPPPVDARSANALKRLYGGGADSVEVSARIANAVDELRHEQVELKDAEERVALLKNEVKAALGDYEVGTYDGVPIVTWGRSIRTGLNKERLAEAYPDVVAEFTKATPVRTLRLKRPR